ncbi:MAG TPA: NAD(P)-binding domain-containing protein [Chitinophaga sp.]|uniref:NAD(P)-dependent oxidoreductase n=1 Tax=Chitinophaga sp. TaxID=1869181 RepID=UPI002C9BF78D|nr:NAD(P)-binding domain-containing protein [Chitinophaga sp.]HVI44372.1 NAD(P)-binding domain-containing protein [Chitinophaga sp.]
MATTNSKVTVIGLGSMGATLAKTLLAKGLQVTVWNRDSKKAAPLAEKGAILAPSAAAAIEASPVTIVCVSNYKANAAILVNEAAGAALKGRTLVQLSTGTPKEARDLETWVLAQGADYIDGDILAWPSQIGEPPTTILAAGKKETYEKVKEMLYILGGNITYMGEAIGAPAALFSAVLSYMAGQWIGLAHGALILEAEGLRVDEYGALLENISPILGGEAKHLGAVIQQSKYENPESSVKTSGEDIIRLVQLSQEAGISEELPRFAADIFKRTIDAGYGAEEHAAIIKVMRK